MTNKVIAVIKVGGKLVDQKDSNGPDQIRRTARVIAQIANGAHPMVKQIINVSFSDGSNAMLTLSVSHPLCSGTKFKPLHEAPDKVIVVTGAGPQMDRACKDGKKDGIRVYTP